MFVHLFFIQNWHINEIIQYLSFSVWLISLSIIPSRSIPIVPVVEISFFFYALWPSNILSCALTHVCVCVCVCVFLNHSFIDGHLSCLAIVNNASVNIGMYMFFLISVFMSLDKHLGVELLDHVVALFLFVYLFWGISILITIAAAPITFPPAVQEDSLFSTSWSTLTICCLLDNSHSDRYEVRSHCDFDLHFPDD